MRPTSRSVSIATSTVLVAMLAACGATGPTQPVSGYPSSNYPQTTYPQNTYPQSSYPTYPQNTYPQANIPQPSSQVSREYGRITNIESVQADAPRSNNPNVRNAVIGGVIGAVVGSVLGKNVNDGHNRSGATVLGGVAGAAVGSQVGRGQAPQDQVLANPAYRVVIQTDAGAMRTYEVGPSTGDLRVGDRVRVENGVIYRS